VKPLCELLIRAQHWRHCFELAMITYDEAKRIANLKKHGLDFVGCETIFDEFKRNDNIRIISLRKATSNEHKRYFEARGD
jgi:hypothetical protein